MSVQGATAVNGVKNNPFAANKVETLSDAKKSYGKGTGKLGKDDFMQLLVTQLANQDPLNPMEDKEFIAQMANFSELEQMTNLNKTMTNFAKGQALSQYSPLVGKNVEGIDTNGQVLSGKVNSIKFKDGKVYATIGETSVPVEYINTIKI